MRFGILGYLEVADGGAPLPLGGRRRRSLLARLLVDANAVVSTGALIDTIWPGTPPPGATQTLRSHLAALRRIVGPARIAYQSGGYRLAVGDYELDSTSFEAMTVRGRVALATGDAEMALASLEHGLRLWRGAALADVADQPWATGHAARLEELRLLATEAALDARLALGDHAGMVSLAERLVADHPSRERVWAQLMLGLYRSGRQADALAAYQRLRAFLGNDLGLVPSAELRALEVAILTHSDALTWAAPTAS